MNRQSTASDRPAAHERVEAAGVSGTHPRTVSLEPSSFDEVLALLDQQDPQPTKAVLGALLHARRELARRELAIRKLRQRLTQLESRLGELEEPPASADESLSFAANGATVQWRSLCFDGLRGDTGADEHRELHLEFTAETEFFAGLNQDMAQGGVFVATYRREPVGTPLALEFELPCGTNVTARGRVAWLRDTGAGQCRPGLGVQFTELSPAALVAIARYAKHVPPLYMEW
ncbi:MAG TPA: PilZ domain-containing protein [Polyangiaceae bacterium]